MYAMQRPALRKWAEDHRHGVGRPRLGLKTIREIPVPLPPLKEQRRVVDILEEHFSRLDAAETGLHSAANRLRHLRDRIVMSQLLGESEPGERLPNTLEAMGVDDGQIAALPDGWRWRRLGDLAEVVGGVTKDAKRQSDQDFVEVPYLRVANVQRGHLELSYIAKIRVAPNKAEALELRRGDVLLNEGGDRDKLARGWVWDGQVAGCIHQNHVFRARVRNEQIEPRLLSWAANTLGASWAERNGKQSVNLASISLSKIRLMPIPVPPRHLQASMAQSIEEHVSAAERLTTEVRGAQQRSLSLRHSLLDAAFSGRLTGKSVVPELEEELASV